MRFLFLKAILFGVISYPVIVFGQSLVAIHQPHDERQRDMKAENGLIISWFAGRVTDSEANQVDIFDENGRPVTSLNVLRPIEGARQVSIYDVSGQPNSVIAVAAVYDSKDQEVDPASALLLFDFSGRLLSAYALDLTHGIMRLAVDENSNVWTFTDNFFHDKAPPTAPAVVEYTPDGKIAKEPLPLGVLYSHGGRPEQSMENGRMAMGYDAGTVWIWLPGSTALVTISASDGDVKIVQTGLAKRDGYKEVPLDAGRDSSGNVIEVAREENGHGGYGLAYFAWSPSTELWSRFTLQECAGYRVIGRDNSGLVFGRFEADKMAICPSRK